MFKNRQQLVRDDLSSRTYVALDALEAGIGAVHPSALFKEKIRLADPYTLVVDGRCFDLSKFRRIVVVGAGKSSAQMAEALEGVLGDTVPYSGFVIVPEGAAKEVRTRRITLHESTHPNPTEKGVQGSKETLGLVRGAGEDTLVISLISGGGSALMPLPAEGISLDDYTAANKLLLKSGATIDEVNCVRKHISAISGGNLVAGSGGATFLSLIISDVVGSDLSSIASGPTVADGTTYADALGVIDKYALRGKMPRSITARLVNGRDGNVAETPKPGSEVFGRVHNVLLSENKVACEAMVDMIRKRYPGLNVYYLGSSWTGEARDVAKNLTSLFIEVENGSEKQHSFSAPCVFVWGGESTVTVRGNGVGGRNQEQALASAITLMEHSLRTGRTPEITIAFMGSDGIDGFTDDAGGMVGKEAVERAKGSRQTLDLHDSLLRNDSNRALHALRSLLRTGRTGVNVNDIGIAVVGKL
ncbi:MAG: DUF4147 domain-containing protein [Candidatus Micrarchaeota archaeon]|nr:DUF4147 domain-containing protein [Candidatus Micrarchaeota archaeon]